MVVIAVETQPICPYCNRLFSRKKDGENHNRRIHCYKDKCIKAHAEVMRKRKRADQAKHAKEWYHSPRKESKPKPKPLIRCRSCGKMKPGPFDVCFECREIKRGQIDAGYMFLADDVRLYV